MLKIFGYIFIRDHAILQNNWKNDSNHGILSKKHNEYSLVKISNQKIQVYSCYKHTLDCVSLNFNIISVVEISKIYIKRIIFC